MRAVTLVLARTPRNAHRAIHHQRYPFSIALEVRISALPAAQAGIMLTVPRFATYAMESAKNALMQVRVAAIVVQVP